MTHLSDGEASAESADIDPLDHQKRHLQAWQEQCMAEVADPVVVEDF